MREQLHARWRVTACLLPAAACMFVLYHWQARVLERVLASGLGWDFRMCELRLGSDDEGDDEDGPVVVELSEQQQLDALAAAGYAVIRSD